MEGVRRRVCEIASEQDALAGPPTSLAISPMLSIYANCTRNPRGSVECHHGASPDRFVRLASERHACRMRRPSVSRMPEIRTSGLNGALRKRSQCGTAPEVY